MVNATGGSKYIPKSRRRSMPRRTSKNFEPCELDPDGYMEFIEPEHGRVSYTLNLMFETLFSPQCASLLIILICIISSFLAVDTKISIGTDNKCTDIKDIFYYKPTGINYYTELKVFNSHNGTTPSQCKEDMYTQVPYVKTLYGVIQSTMIFMLVMTLGAGLEKYREEIRLYEALSGDIKAMAMFMTHLTYDGQKYELDEAGKLQYRSVNIREQYEKVRVLLAVLGPVARIVLKGDELKQFCGTETEPIAKAKELETKKLYREYNKDEKNCFPFKWCAYDFRCCRKRCKLHYRECCKIKAYSIWCPCAEKYKRIPLKWSEYKAKKKDELDPQATKIEYDLYKKLELEQSKTRMDLFETVMSVLIDELMVITENDMGFGTDEGSAVMSAIYTKWEGIYASWGAMSSIKTFSEPTLVHTFRTIMLLGYAIMMPYSYIDIVPYHTRSIDFTNPDISWYFILTFADICVFCLMWFIAYEIRNPFEDVRCMKGVKGISSQTQYHVLNLMKYQQCIEAKEYEGRKPTHKLQEETPEDSLLKRILEEIQTTNALDAIWKLSFAKEISIGNRDKIFEILEGMLKELEEKNTAPKLKALIENAIREINNLGEQTLNQARQNPPPDPPKLRRRALNF
mgnify:CR=1 FL=1